MEENHEERIRTLERDVEQLKEAIQMLAKRLEPHELSRVLGEEMARSGIR